MDMRDLAGPAVEDDREAPWPSSTDNLRDLNTSGLHHALIGWYSGLDPAYGVVEGYRRAAEILANEMLDQYRSLDLLIFPFVMCWRHHVELRLKNMLVVLHRYNAAPAPARHHHKIDVLWAEVKALIVKIHNPVDDDVMALQQAERTLIQLVQIDADGQEFRYHTHRDGTPSLQGIDRIDVERFHTALLGLANFLDTVEDLTEHLREVNNEIASEYADRG